jgi:hypothetical protein
MGKIVQKLAKSCVCHMWKCDDLTWCIKQRNPEIRLPIILGQFPENNWQYNELRFFLFFLETIVINLFFHLLLSEFSTTWKMTKLGLYMAATWTLLCTSAAMPDVSIMDTPYINHPSNAFHIIANLPITLSNGALYRGLCNQLKSIKKPVITKNIYTYIVAIKKKTCCIKTITARN